MLLFRSEENVERWCAAKSLPRGALLTPEQGWQLAHKWYSHRMQPDWRRYTADETHAIFAENGLTGTFWDLR